MRRTSRVAAVAAVATAAAGCGGSSPTGQRSLDAFLSRSPQGRALGKRFPHRPGSIPCTAVDPVDERRVEATCSTDVSLQTQNRVVVTFTLSWSHGSRARTWFVFLRRDGTVESVKREGSLG